MTTREKAPTILTAAGARKLTARIRDAVALADDLLVRAYEGRAWEALGHDSWSAYCAAELPELRMVKLRAEARRERAAALREAGASIPEIVVATGSSLGTIHRDLTPAPVPFQMESRQPVQVAPPVHLSNVDRAVALVAAQGTRGLTVRELCLEAGWHHGQASGALTKAHQRGLIVRSATYRERCAAYLRP
jgi:hypothetical protein